MDARNVVVVSDTQFGQLISFVSDSVGFEALSHVEYLPQAFPCIGSCVGVQLHVPVEDLVDSLLRAHLEVISVLTERVDKPDGPDSLGELANAVPGVIFPPGRVEAVRIPVRIRSYGRNMQVTAVRANVLFHTGSVVNMCYGLKETSCQRDAVGYLPV